MIALSVTGLALDIVGVMMLGVDLVRIQKRLRGDAEDRLAALNDVAEGAGGTEEFLKSISGDFREYYRDEGRYLPSNGTFDYQSAKQSLDELKEGVNGLADHLETLARMLIVSVEGDRETAKISLNVSYGGLGPPNQTSGQSKAPPKSFSSIVKQVSNVRANNWFTARHQWQHPRNNERFSCNDRQDVGFMFSRRTLFS
jgi:hypothetical protein